VKTTRRYGWHPSLPDKRNRKFLRAPVALPPSVDWTLSLPPCYDQGDLGSCTANAIAGAIQFLQGLEHGSLVMPSRLFIYYNERVMEDTIDSDAGAEIMDGIKSVNRQGVCPEDEWPYEDSRLTSPPTPSCYTDAERELLLKYQSVDNTVLDDLKAALVQGPVVGGFSVYDSFESDAVAATGIVPMPNLDSESVQGGHAVLLVGYDDTKQVFIVRNSWGPDWGMNGYFTVPYAYFTDPDLASDFWLCLRVSLNQPPPAGSAPA
jgi:C1A family cysteine protease